VLAGAVSGVGGSVLSSVGAHRTARLARLGWLAPLGYGVGVVAAAAAESRDLPAAARIRLPAIFAVMHLSWGWGFLHGVRGRR
jgi:succinoglycan biosynthesis protein ExoA